MIITVINQKGGTGKTTTAAAMLAYYERRGGKALGVDLDPQCNLSLALGAQRSGGNALGILTGQAKPRDAIHRANYADIIAGAPELSAADEMFSKDIGKAYKLREALEQVKGAYSHIIIDSPPALGVLSVNALTAADGIIIPCQADVFSVQGLAQLADTIEQVRKYTNAGLRVLGILLTRYNQRATLSRDLRDVLEREAEKLGTFVFSTAIRESVTAKEPIAMQESIFTDPTTNAAADYLAFMQELESRISE
ncbi:ParA family protein [Ruminococcus sp.]|uniref:ParA family protein n=1 Tax=Ruminococcus sp. TaxID=41978 RepID=UPI00386691C2